MFCAIHFACARSLVKGLRGTNFCSTCGNSVIQKVPPGDGRAVRVPNLPGYSLPQSEDPWSHSEWEDHILLCRRAIQLLRPLWTYPPGLWESAKVPTGSDTGDGGAQAQVTIYVLHSVLKLLIGQVYMTFIGHLQVKQFGAGFESSSGAAVMRSRGRRSGFPVVKEALCYYIEDARGHFNCMSPTY
ncbi:MAG: hypothetical protein QM706_07665 [Nitrospira sp.]